MGIAAGIAGFRVVLLISPGARIFRDLLSERF
jgi:hypothetical protein